MVVPKLDIDLVIVLVVKLAVVVAEELRLANNEENNEDSAFSDNEVDAPTELVTATDDVGSDEEPTEEEGSVLR